MSETTETVPNDVATRHISVVTTAFLGQLKAGGAVQVPRGNVRLVESLGQTNIFHGMGSRHPNAALIEHATAMPGDVLSDAEIEAGIATAAAKQAAVPGQIAAREAQRKAAIAADPPLTAEERKAFRAMIAAKPGA